jgi:Ca2+-binding EF-hand superfamily protein
MVNGIQGFSNFNVQMMNDMREKMFARLDPDGDGQIDLAELKTKAQEAGESNGHLAKLLESLTAADTDGDGMITREEFEQMPPPPPPPPFAEMRQGLFNRLDSDGDGQIDLTELQAQAEKTGKTDSIFVELLEQLTAADSDGDGIITREEFEQVQLTQNPNTSFGNMDSLLSTKDSRISGTSNRLGMLIDQLG